MKFVYNKEIYSDLGLIVKHGNIGNIVFFWDENNLAVNYILEIWRIPEGDKGEKIVEGFVQETEICDSEAALEKVLGQEPYPYRRGENTCLGSLTPGIEWGKFAMNKIWQRRNEKAFSRCQVIEFEFNSIKPICTISVDRNKFYHSINDLPHGDYIVCLKVEDRQGEIIEEAMPYYFHVEDAEMIADKRAGTIAGAAARYVVCH